MLAGDNIFSAVTSLLPCALGLCDASHVGQSADLTVFGALGAVETPLRILCRFAQSMIAEVRWVSFFFSLNFLLGMQLRH